jgi:hypothetical protein
LAGDGAQFDAILLDLQRLRLLGALSEEPSCLHLSSTVVFCLKSGPF